MKFPETDIVTDIRFAVETTELATALGVCRPLLDEFGAVAVEIERANPESPRTGFLASLFFTCSVAEGETIEQAMRRAVRPAIVKYRLNDENLEIHGDPDRRGFASLRFQKLKVDGYVLFRVVAERGGQETRAPTSVARADSTPREETDIIARVHLRLPVADLNTALDRCLPLVASIGASVIQIVSSRPAGLPEEFCEVALLSATPAIDGEAAEPGLRRVATKLAGQLGLDPDAFEIRGTGDVLIGAIENATWNSGAEQPVEALYVRVDDDPLYQD
ncbi:hypothetical protein SAMN04489729_3284 [Amycolatopsis lurida]|uniref:Uncharacterized protein n=1 Tax=Amycolatopsis lurida NRRL 2430 TaxID=1460371 RepID=A0A2P2FJM0_AMYLU|nr:hypothetical protein [Amycolatopsis lurida]KFU76925.1 hypothetical protein BB31_33875 [Amycolatopsis lurida NRRL 2430]SED07361.1 hypothetical protein SAMN04489729_3284 [Amycolatopsis lurida]